MIRRFLFLLAIVATVLPVAISSAGAEEEESWPFYHWPTSSDYAKKRGEFMFAVKASPDTFTWEGHNVSVYDCWKQHCTTVYYLFFKLKVDGTSTGEHQIFKDTGMYLAFRHAGDEFRNELYGIDGYDLVPPLRRILKACVGIPSTEVVHFVRLTGPDTKEVRLRVGTLRRYKFPTKYLENHQFEDPNYQKSRIPTMSDTVITFDVSKDVNSVR